jgi:ClpP class serine protease
MSGGTLIALAADEIVMDKHAVLGPVDPQLGEFPAASLVKVAKTKKIDEMDDKTLIMADIAEKALKQIRSEVRELLGQRMAADKAEELTDKLTQGIWTHDHPIGFHEAQQLSLPVRSDMPDDFYNLMALYPQPMRRHPTVQYFPTPYGPVMPNHKQ